ncbi:MAG: hypothetical protein Kow00117_12230 [Phototrophicales bacterium]|nr:MAG: hypothetical protein CUN56_06585 [Phototrophicales bacterium]RMG71858.1 MAG: hypothetical protein D6711_14365 [Chloroflexota bacterium]
MQIKRDYSNTFFRKNERSGWRLPAWAVFLFGLLIGGTVLFVSTNLEELQMEALEMFGMGPTATPLPGDLATLGERLFVAGDLEAAADLFERAIALRPNNIDYLYVYGQLLIDMNAPERALELGNRILEININDPRGYVLRGRAQVWTGDPNGAISSALSGLELNSGYESELYGILARAYTDAGQYIEGVQAGEQAVQANPSDAEARRSYAYSLSWIGDNEEAIAQLEAAIILKPNYIPVYLELALHYLAQNRDQDAIDLYDQVLAIQPRNARALLRLCTTYRKIGQFERAIGFCQDAVNADPTSVASWYQLGLLQYNRYQFADALYSFGQCIENDPESVDCLHRLGLSYYYVMTQNACVGENLPEGCRYRTTNRYYAGSDCASAWNILQDSLILAQGEQAEGRDVSGIIANIQEGLVAIGQVCPEYGRFLPTPTPTPFPEGYVPPAEETPEAIPAPGEGA